MIKNSHSSISSFIVFILISSLMSCSLPSIKTDSIKIERLIFLNNSTRPLSNVRIYVTKTRELVKCGYILPKTECSLSFPLREYQGNRFDVSWLDNDQSRSVKNILVVIPGNLMTGKPVNAVIIFDEHGQFSARLQY